MSIASRLRTAFAFGRTRPTVPYPRDRLVSPMLAGEPVTHDTAMTVATVYACVSVVAQDVANLPWHGFRRTGGSQAEVADIDALLSRRVNDEMGARTFREALLSHAMLWGNGYAEIERNRNNRAVGLHLITPDRVEPKRTPAGVLYYEVSPAEVGPLIEMSPRDIFHIRGLSWDGVRGYSRVWLAARTLGINLALDTTAASFFGNGANPGAVIEIAGKLSPEGKETLLEQFRRRFVGPRRSGSPLLLDAGMKLTPLTMPFAEAQFLESRNFSVEEICRWFGVPPHKVAHLVRSTFSNIEHQGIDYVATAIRPWVRRLEEEADLKLTPGTQVEFTKLNLNGLLRGDAPTRAQFYREMRNMGALSVNEIRALEDMNGIGPDGDVYVMQSQYVPLDKLGETQTPPALTRQPAGDAPDPDAASTDTPPEEAPR